MEAHTGRLLARVILLARAREGRAVTEMQWLLFSQGYGIGSSCCEHRLICPILPERPGHRRLFTRLQVYSTDPCRVRYGDITHDGRSMIRKPVSGSSVSHLSCTGLNDPQDVDPCMLRPMMMMMMVFIQAMHGDRISRP